MFLLPLSRRVSRPLNSIASQYISNTTTSPFPTTSSCPSPPCQCSETPEMPEGFPIDYSKPLNGTMAAYAEQIVICTGRDDWDSRIERENEGDNLAADLKALVGPKGPYHDPYNPISILNSSFPKKLPSTKELYTSTYLLPSFKYVPFVLRNIVSKPTVGDPEICPVPEVTLKALATQYLLPKGQPSRDTEVSSEQKPDTLQDDRSVTNSDAYFAEANDVKHILVLVCGHGGRDIRCGILGPLLRNEFSKVLEANGIRVPTTPPSMQLDNDRDPRKYQEFSKEQLPAIIGEEDNDVIKTARVGLISHIGGHKFAGNIIVYIPPGMKKAGGEDHELAGCGIWYGRVEPKHVDGIVKETVLGGRVIQDMFRGGIRKSGEILRI
ncbi:Sucraseferredoxin-like protein [Calycina marina]|uniref:Altered inheritance of mitochondria protein 32 n=1 Tax=Calycina marina TaxID=1763456 RepID=A0A9P7Z662_9HELO|nr:Sucraseferredoxin-like protein [Calycina marina]